MHMKLLAIGVSTADTSYPRIAFDDGRLVVGFSSSEGRPVSVSFLGVAAFSWRENGEALLPGEPWDGSCELFDSELLRAHAPGATIGSVEGLRHFRLRFHEWGCLDVLCTGYAEDVPSPDTTSPRNGCDPAPAGDGARTEPVRKELEAGLLGFAVLLGIAGGVLLVIPVLMSFSTGFVATDYGLGVLALVFAGACWGGSRLARTPQTEGTAD